MAWTSVARNAKTPDHETLCLASASRQPAVRGHAHARLQSGEVHVLGPQEISFEASRDYANPYVDVTVWIELSGPDFARKVYGFWTAAGPSKVRFVATAPGEWRWKVAATPADDAGLNGGAGALRAVAWSAEEIAENPNRRGFVRASPNGHALVYADGSPFFLLGDTWLAASTWRLPYRGAAARPDYVPGPGISFEEAVAWRKRQGFNSVSFIAAFPNWAADARRHTRQQGRRLPAQRLGEVRRLGAQRQDLNPDGATTTAKDMHDEQGHRPFEVFPDREGLANFDRIDRATASLDRKMRHLADQGFVPFLETIRRDNAPAWKRFRLQHLLRALRALHGRALRRLQPRVPVASTSTGSPGLQPHGG